MRRGGILLEVLVSLALFVGAAAFALGATRSVLSSIDRARREAMAIDLARAKMAELEAGLITLSDLREASSGVDAVGSFDEFMGEETYDRPSATPGWIIDVSSERSGFTGLTLVELTVSEDVPEPTEEDVRLISYTLRQLVALRDEVGEEEYETDEMLRGLPEGR